MLNWAVGILCLLLGALMLVAPHQFARPIYVSIRPHLAWWGLALEVSGLALVATLLIPRNRRLYLLGHGAAGGVILALGAGFAATASWSAAASFVILGIGVLSAPWLTGCYPRLLPGAHSLVGVLVATTSVLVGVLSLSMPRLFDSSVYDALRPYLSWYGSANALGGVILLSVYARRCVPRKAYAAAHLFAAAPLVVLCASVCLPARSWTGVLYYGGFGALIAILPWLAPRLQVVDGSSLRVRLALALAAVAAIPLLLVASADADRDTRTATQEALRQQQGLAVALARDVADYVGLHRAAASALAGYPGLLRMSADDQRSIVHSFGAAYPDAVVFAVYDAAGEALVRSDDRPLTSAAGFGVFENARRDNSASLDVLIGPLVNRPIFAFGAPIFNERGEFSGLVNTALESSRLAAMLARASGDTQTTAYLVDAAGRAIAHPDAALTARFANLSDIPPVLELRSDPSTSGSLEYMDGTDEQLAGYAPVAGLGWGVVVVRPSSVALATARDGRDAAFGILLLVILAAATAGALVAARLAAPLRALASAAQRLTVDETSVALPVTRVSEMADLTEAFRTMHQHLTTRTAERELAYDKLQELLHDVERERATLAGVMAGMSDGLIVVDAYGGIRYVNARAGSLLGIDPDATIGSSARNLLDQMIQAGAVPETSLSVWQQALSRVDESPSFEVTVAGTPARDLLLQIFPVRDAAGQRLGVGILQRDVTPERDLARTKDELVSVVSHELRTPLASVVGFAELLLLRTPTEAQRQQYLTVMVEEGRRLTALINDFLDLQRIDGGHLVATPAPIALAPILEKTIAAAGVDVACPLWLDVQPDLPLVMADAERVVQVLSNFLSNARKYSPAGGPVQVTAVEAEGHVTVSVRDHGLGLPPQSLPRLFEKFYRVDNSDRRTITGTGLGLAVSRKIIEAQGGSVSAESEGLGHGSRFSFTLPIASNRPTPDVLVVEDDVSFARLLEAKLASHGRSVVVVGSAEAALAHITTMPSAVMVLDLLLPGSSGETFLRELRELGHMLPAVVVTVKDLTPAERSELADLRVVAIHRKGPGVAAFAAESVANALTLVGSVQGGIVA